MRRPSTAKLADVLQKANGLLSPAARALGCSRTSLSKWVEDCEELQQVVHDCRETFIDVAEGQVQSAVKAGELWAVTLVLKTLGRDRGYVESKALEHSGPGGGPIQQRVAGQLDHLLALSDEEAAELVARAEKTGPE